MPELKQVEAEDESLILEALDIDGGVIVRNYLSPETLENVRTALSTAIEGLPWCNGADSLGAEFFGLKTKRLHGLMRYGAELEGCLMHPLAQKLAAQFLDSRVAMSTGELMAIGPEETQQALHRDGDSWRRAKLDRNLLFSVNIALTDFRQDNGATVVVAGSHRWPAERQAEPAEYCYAEMPAGSALVYSGKVLHSGGQNETQETRMGLYFGYIPSWLRPLENSAQLLPEEVCANLGKPTRQMLGLGEEGFTVLL